jgi:hypothetical protein
VRSTPALLALAGALGAAAAPAVTLSDPGQGAFAFPAGAAQELSGLAWAGGLQFYSVSDDGGLLAPLEIAVDPASGFVTDVQASAPIALAGRTDLEGIVFDAVSGTVLVADEVGPAIAEHRLSDGALVATLPVPAIYAGVRPNLSLESLTMGRDGSIWTANEEALDVDGPVSDFAAGTRVRLQRFDPAGNPDGQWGYWTDPIPGAPILGQERSGVADVLALPGGELLVLERAFSTEGFRARLYETDFTGATDTTHLAGLTASNHTPVAKTLRFETIGGFNYEGLDLGPDLDAGDRSLLLVADNAGVADSNLYALRAQIVPEPSSLAQMAVGAAVLALLGRGRGRINARRPAGHAARSR